MLSARLTFEFSRAQVVGVEESRGGRIEGVAGFHLSYHSCPPGLPLFILCLQARNSSSREHAYTQGYSYLGFLLVFPFADLTSSLRPDAKED